MILSVSLTQCYRCTSRQRIYRQCGLKHRRISTALSPTAYPDEYATTTSISDEEFLRCFQSCLPSPLWPNKIAVAFSGGPDSTCLLHLLKQISTKIPGSNLPMDVLAITVDHGLQATSSAMTDQCALIAKSLDVNHISVKIPWDQPPFPPLPGEHMAFEKIARYARYHVLFDVMQRENISDIAFGHHADDQVETALLRILNRSSEYGASAMRPARRWGMGFGKGPGSLSWVGHLGMDKWILRPLLRIPKNRLIKTCVDQRLQYVVDPTNFQPEITPRNHIRHFLTNNGDTEIPHDTSGLGIDLACMTLLKMGAKAPDMPRGHKLSKNPGLQEHISQLSVTDRLSSAIDELSNRAAVLDNRVSNELKACALPAPISTFLLSYEMLQRVTDNSVRLAIVRRLLRYVSPFPWGSPHAEAGQRSASLQKIVDQLWGVNSPNTLEDSKLEKPWHKFVAGAQVLWTPVILTRKGRLKHRLGLENRGERKCWLISRQPPIRNNSKIRDDELNTNVSDLLVQDITPNIVNALQNGIDGSVEILYDCRFLLRIRVDLLPPLIADKLFNRDLGSGMSTTHSAKLLIVPYSDYYLPKIVLRQSDLDSTARETEYARLLPSGEVASLKLENNKSVVDRMPVHSHQNQEAIQIEWVRVLDADVPYQHVSTLHTDQISVGIH